MPTPPTHFAKLSIDLFKSLLAVAAAVGLSACASAPVIDQSTRPTPQAVAQRLDAQPPPAGTGQVVVYRSRSPAVPGKLLAIQVNGQPVGGLGSETFLRLNLPPGEHSFTAAATTQWQASTRLRVTAGETAFLHFDLRRYPRSFMVGTIWVTTPTDGGAFLRPMLRAEALTDLVGLSEVDLQAQAAATASSRDAPNQPPVERGSP